MGAASEDAYRRVKDRLRRYHGVYLLRKLNEDTARLTERGSRDGASSCKINNSSLLESCRARMVSDIPTTLLSSYSVDIMQSLTGTLRELKFIPLNSSRLTD